MKTFKDYQNEKNAESLDEGKSFASFNDTKQGQVITNPFYDSTGRSGVDPEKEYGADYAKSDLKKFIDASESLNNSAWKFKELYDLWKNSAPNADDVDASDMMLIGEKHAKIMKAACEVLLKLK